VSYTVPIILIVAGVVLLTAGLQVGGIPLLLGVAAFGLAMAGEMCK
jgi:hypothetical protein